MSAAARRWPQTAGAGHRPPALAQTAGAGHWSPALNMEGAAFSALLRPFSDPEAQG